MPLENFSFKDEIWLAPLSQFREIKPSPDRNFYHLITCFRHYNILAKTRGRTTAMKFSRQNDAVSRASAA